MNNLIIENCDNNKYAENFYLQFNLSNKKKYVLGINNYSESIINNYKIDGVIDDYTNETTFKGIPIVKTIQVKSGSLVLSCIVEGKTINVDKKLSSYQFSYLDYYSFKSNSKKNIKEIQFWDNNLNDISKNYDRYNEVYKNLADEISKKQFYNLINFKKNYNINFMKNFNFQPEAQYFEDFLKLNKNDEVFVDAGGFDGFTSQEFIKNCPNYQEIFFFEPDSVSLKQAKKKLDGQTSINYIEAGLSSETGVIGFSLEGSQSKVDSDNSNKINVFKLDDIIKNKKVTYIKMDIEGSEYDAIIGSKNTIEKNHPKLAICVYHKYNDFYIIPETILSIRSDYNIYFRHYTQGCFETVMYFLPINKT